MVFIGRSPTAMWMRVVSSWICVALYGWSLLAPVLRECYVEEKRGETMSREEGVFSWNEC